MRNDVPGPALDALTLRLARATAAGMDVPAVLTDVCHTLSGALAVRGALAVALRRGASGRDELGPVAGSDEQFARLGRVQRDTAGGPLSATLRFGRPLLTTDLLRAGPPELAASVAELGVTGSLTIPLAAAGELVGAVQLLGDHTAPVGLGQLEPLAPVLDVLAARLHDARVLDGHGFDARQPAGQPLEVRAPETRPVGRAPGEEPGEVNRAAEGWPPVATPAETQVLSARGPDAERPERPDPDPSESDPSESATIAIPLPTVDSDTTELRVDRIPSGGRHAAPRPTPRPRPADAVVPEPRRDEPVESTEAGPGPDAEKTGTIPTAPPQPRDPEPPARHPRTAL